MSERILKALMQLFAIIAKVDGVTNSGRYIVQSFLKQQLNQELVDEYLKLFDEFVEKLQGGGDSEKRKKKTSVNSVKVLKICTEINKELTQKQKVVVLIRLIEFINSNDETSEQELEFVKTVSEVFNIEDQEFIRCSTFINSSKNEFSDSSNLLLIDNSKELHENRSRHLYVETLSGEIRVLQISSVSMYILRYFGTAELYLNGQLLTADKAHILTPGSTIRSSKVSPIYYSDIISSFMTDKTASKIVFQTKSLEFKFKNEKIGLHKFNMFEESGTLIGIMGGSGAGKSTLLNILNGNDKPSGGEVLINGINIHTEKNKIEGVIGHVSQDDLLIEQLTVFQNLFYNAKLCFDNLSDKEISKIVLELLISIGLYETRDLKVGSPLEKTISGGQRKRLNIALELIREPSVLFVDEPTSGLSSRDSENIMDLLKELALKGKLVFVVIHQPSSEIFKMFDKLIILDLGGYAIYNGNPVEAIIYFKTLVNHVNANESECVTCGNVNPEQIFNIIESKVLDEYGDQTQTRKISPKEWNEFYTQKLEPDVEAGTVETEIPKSTFRIPNKIKQFGVFITRDVLSKLTNKQYLIINLFEAPVLALILSYLVRYFKSDVSNKAGYVFYDNENMPAYMFMSVVVALFIGLTVSAEEIIADRKILKRESFLNLSKGSYLFSKVSIMFTLSAIQTLSFILIGNTILGIKGMYLDYWFVLFTTSCFANMLGLNISASFNSAVTIYILIPFLIIPQLLLSGVIVKFDKLNPVITTQGTVPVSGEVMTSRWAFEALAVNQFKKNEFEKNFYMLDKSINVYNFRKDDWLKALKAKVDNCENIVLDINERNDKSKIAELEYDLSVLKSEYEKHNQKDKNSPVFKALDKLTLKDFNRGISGQLKEYNKQLDKYFIHNENIYRNKKDSLVTQKIFEWGSEGITLTSQQLDLYNGKKSETTELTALQRFQEQRRRKLLIEKDSTLKDSLSTLSAPLVVSRYTSADSAIVRKVKEDGENRLNDLKSNYVNKSLDDLVTNIQDFDKIVEVDSKLIQRKNPVYLDPPKNSIIRAHFFAPRKRVFGQYFDTFWVNISVIWAMSLLLAFTLYFDVLKKLMDFFGDFSSRFKFLKKK
ncbi:MAG: ATP-binding cassette domain-containing protein [Bacteroidetes bacterium]|nr:ATP-binding cassette domain-containing protein [Bacteroidota bacterium]MBK9800189.1 ATP-binding cassette domain-containing protein [Bacteroidota bacterium]